MALNDKAMLVKLSISQWSGNKEDDKVSRETCERHSAVVGAGKFVKHIVPDSALDAVRKSARRLYGEHNMLTLPWMDDGARILKADAFEIYKGRIDAEKAVFESSVNDFISRYDELQAESQRTHGDLYNAGDWPSKDSLSKRFGVMVKPFPMIGSDFREEIFNKIPQADKDAIIAAAKADEDALHQACIADVFTRIRAVVGDLSTKLQKYKQDSGGKTRMHDSIVGNIINLVDLLPALNVTDDERIAEMGAIMKREMACYDAETLKYSEHARSNAQAAADAMLEKMKQYSY